MNTIFKLVSKETILNSIKFPQDSIVFLSGSLINGIGNKKSDIDIFILYDKPIDVRKYEISINDQEVKLKFKKINKIGIDIEYWKLCTLESLVDKLNNISFHELNRIEDMFPEDKLGLIHRFLIGVPIYNENRFKILHSKLNIKNYFRISCRYIINNLDNFYEDMIGNYEANRFKTAYIIAHNCLIKAMQAYLFSKGISSDREKWVHLLFEKFAESNDEAKKLLNRADEILIENKYNENLKFAIEKSIELINEIVAIVQDSMEVL